MNSSNDDNKMTYDEYKNNLLQRIKNSNTEINPNEYITVVQTKIKLIYNNIFIYTLAHIEEWNAIVNSNASIINEIM